MVNWKAATAIGLLSFAKKLMAALLVTFTTPADPIQEGLMGEGQSEAVSTFFCATL